MELSIHQYARGTGWDRELPRDWDSDRVLAVVFAAPEYAEYQAPMAELCGALPRAAIVGCSTAGEIHGAAIQDESLAVAIVRFDDSRVEVAATRVDAPGDSRMAGEVLAQALQRDDLRGILVLSDGLNVNGSGLVRGINSAIDPSVVVTGGLAGDGDRFESTWVLHNGVPTTNVITAVGLYGDRVKIGHGSKGGWDLFGPERTVTRSDDNVLYELDGKPALELYKRYLGERAEGLPATALLFPLSLRIDGDDSCDLVRTVLAVDEEQQSMTFAGDIPSGSAVRLMRANFDRLIQGASEAAQLANSNPSGGDVLSIAVSCVGRRIVLGERSEEEIEATLEILPPQTRQIGFYSYGEISPHASGRCDLHNQTMTLTTVAES